MKSKTKYILVTVIIGIVSFLLTRVIWPDPAGAVMPSTTQLPLFMFLGILESLLFGAGVSFIIFGKKFFSNGDILDKLIFIAAVWMMVSWWPHDNMHRIWENTGYWHLLTIEYIFHFTQYISAAIVGLYVWRQRSKTLV